VEKKKGMIKCYDKLYSETSNFKEEWDGKMATEYKVPKYISVFMKNFSGKKAMRVLELGAGNGEVSELINNKKFIKEYVASEISASGVKQLKKKGFEAYKVDAQDLSRFKDDSFDLVFAVDVMHHVTDPKKMAQEMVRVSKKYVFLIEANGVCVLRRVLEKVSQKYKDAGENSYSPWKYKSFFKPMKVSIKPFLFAVPFIPDSLIKPMGFMSDILEDIPLVRWQGSGVIIYGEK